MSSKKSLRLSTKPGVQPKPQEKVADAWVENRSKSDLTVDSFPESPRESPKLPGKTKRITFEVTEAQHQATKIRATRKGMTIKELMQSLLEQELNKGD
jgi:predicted DNA binding CopG/RHH family protein